MTAVLVSTTVKPVLVDKTGVSSSKSVTLKVSVTGAVVWPLSSVTVNVTESEVSSRPAEPSLWYDIWPATVGGVHRDDVHI